MAGTGKTVTYAELDERSNRLAQWWYAAGLRTGDGVAMLSPRAYCRLRRQSGIKTTL
jgi:long-chain acyl-CoA synthetase